ncbi:MAG: hypothetical protein ACRCT1_06095 [Microcoleaceae cyanobacterium]
MAEATGNETVSDITRAHSTPLNVPVDVPESEVVEFEYSDDFDDSEDSDDSED